MNYLVLIIVVFCCILSVLCNTVDNVCNTVCPSSGVLHCGFEPKLKKYTLFRSKCAMDAYTECHKTQFIKTPLKFCIKYQLINARRFYGESCPVFCPAHYRPVCGASKLRSYLYKTFNNGCYFDMLNCRGDDDNGYVEVPLEFCQRHLMKNIFREQVVISGAHDYRDYHDY